MYFFSNQSFFYKDIVYIIKMKMIRKFIFLFNKFVIKIFNEKLKVKFFSFFPQHGKFQFFKI